MSGPPVVFLVGFMGCGKSSVGRALATQCEVAFIDLDERIAARAGHAVHEIFARAGEEAFRAHERAELLALEPVLANGAVIATGGGTFTDPAVRAWIAMHGVSVWLDATLDVIEHRVPRDGSRPLFGDRIALEQLYETRRPSYAQATHRVEAGAGAIADVARAIARKLRVGEKA